MQHVQFRLAHRALESEQEPVVEVSGIVDAVLVEDQRVAQRADLQQPMPVGGVAGQPRDLEPEHDAGATHADFGDQVLEPLAVLVGSGLTEVGVDHDNPLGRPAERHRPLAQCILAARALRVLDHLAHRGLAHIEVGVAAQVAGAHLPMRIAHAAVPVRWGRTIAIRMSIAWLSTPAGSGPGEHGASPMPAGVGNVARTRNQAATPRHVRTASPSRSCRGPDRRA